MILDFIKNRLMASLLRSDIAVSLGLMVILLVMIIPLPTYLLDLLLTLNITTALLILIITLYIRRSLEFAIFPTVLLITTLFRLALNVASTRLILLQGDSGPMAAGQVIYSFGQFVVGGDYVVGVVVFIILVVVNFIVITKGANRVAEVSARFTLDAMPGKQMAIDADLNTGAISEEEASRRREEISRESDFFGAMDGASKFVRGDAIAGIIITFINICAGLSIGVMKLGMPLVDAAQNYTILTIGDGLVGQIPALIISTAAGILVSRTRGNSDLGSEIKSQLNLNPRAILVVSGISFFFAVLPGLPLWPFLFISGLLGWLGWHMLRKGSEEAVDEADESQPLMKQEENYEELLTVDLLELEVGYGLVPLVDASREGELLDRIRSIRKQFVQTQGVIIPPVHIRDNLQLGPNQYVLFLKGVRIAGGEIQPNNYLALEPGSVSEKVEGTETTEPAFGLPALWISEEMKERALIAGYTVVDCNTTIATHLSEVIKRHLHELLGRQEVQNLLDNTAKSYPKLVEELVPNLMSLGVVMRVLKNLLREEVSIRDMRTIMETLADNAAAAKETDILTEYVRQALARQISMSIAGEDNVLPVITFDTKLEKIIQKSVQYSGQGSYMALDPKVAEQFLASVSEQVGKSENGKQPVLLCEPNIRPHVKRLTEKYLPRLSVLSYNEVTSEVQIQSMGTVQIHAG